MVRRGSDSIGRSAAVFRLTLVGLSLSAYSGCASIELRPGDSEPSSLVQDAPPAGTIQLSSYEAADPDLHDPLASADEAGVISRWQVTAQTKARSAYDDVVGIVRVSRKRRWDEWAAVHLRSGDIVFLQGSSNKVVGVIDFSKLSRQVANSDFTHVGVVAIEDGRAVIYDVDRPGPGRIPFGTMVASPHVRAVAVKRLRPECRDAIPAAVAYCRQVYDSRLPFDRRLKLGNDRLYCAEMVELAFRSGGQILSRPIRWKDLPEIDEHPIPVSVIQFLNGADLGDRVLVPGNDQIGLWSSPDLELVLGLTRSRSVPPI